MNRLPPSPVPRRVRPIELRRVLRDLGPRRRVFHYFEDRFALDLLSWAVGDGAPVAKLKRGRFARLLDRPAVRASLRRGGVGRLDRQTLRAAWPDRPEAYALTFGHWGETDAEFWEQAQVSRAGMNLVVQVHLPRGEHRWAAQSTVTEPAPFLPPYYDGHFGDRHTLGWARLDLDRRNGEALIEEVQSDWIAPAALFCTQARAIRSLADRDRFVSIWGVETLEAELTGFVDRFLSRQVRWWADAILASALDLCVRRYGIRRIFFHTPESGVYLKHIEGDAPPRSVYTRLPRRFCFAPTDELPTMLDHVRYRQRARRRPRWRLQLLEL